MSTKYTVRAQSSKGRRPSLPIIAESFALLAIEEFAWSAVHDEEPHITYEAPVVNS